MDKPGALQVLECVQDGREHLASLVAVEGAFGNDLGEEFLGQVCDDVDDGSALHFGAAVVVDVREMGVREPGGRGPACEAIFCRCCGREQLDRVSLGADAVEFGEEGTAGAGSTEPLEEWI